MKALLREDRGPDQVVVVCLTTGDRDTLPAALASADANLRGPIGRRLVCVDGPAGGIAIPDGWDAVSLGDSRQGYPAAVAAAKDYAIGSGQPWIFWLEDDFTFDQPVDLAAMAAIMARTPRLAQLSLKRQPWYDYEVAAGGIIEAHPYRFWQRDGFVEHRDYWTMNPMLTRREVLAMNGWPQGSYSEKHFGENLFARTDYFAGILGKMNDPPRVTHHGQERVGHGY